MRGRVSEESIAKVADSLSAIDTLFRRNFDRRRDVFDSLRLLAGREPFDAEAVRTAFRQGAVDIAREDGHLAELVASVLERLPARERSTFVDALAPPRPPR